MKQIQFVYKTLSEEQKSTVIQLWTSSGVLSLLDAQSRVNEVSTLIKEEDTIVGVSTVYLKDFIKPNNPYFFFRMFIDQAHRGSNVLRSKILAINFNELKKSYGSKAHGIVVELENQKLSKLGENTDYMQKRGWSYAGKNPAGLQVWYVRFDEPKGIFT